MFQLALKGRQRIGQNDVVRQAVSQLGSGDREGSTADYRQFDWWHNNTIGASRTQHVGLLVDHVDQPRGRVDRGKMERFHVGPCTSVLTITS